jgi:DNA invertase Pin-like site-specific DNA recombinase
MNQKRARRKKQVADISQVVGYIRCSTSDQAESGLGLEAQLMAIRTECERRGWTLVKVCVDEGLSGKDLDRPGVMEALEMVESGQVGTLMVSKLDRLSRSLFDFASLMERARKNAWNLVALDLGVDLSTPQGEFLASVMAAAAAWERRIISQRTKDALAVKRAQGVRLGRRPVLDPELVAELVGAYEGGSGWTAIARDLNERGVATAQGGKKWYPSTVRAVVLSEADYEVAA